MDIKRLFIDTETTGLDEKIHGVHQIACLIEINGKVIEKVNIKLKPFDDCIYDDDAFKTHRISKEIIETYQSEIDGYEQLVGILYKYVNKYNKEDKFTVVGYNIRFDINFIYQLFIRNNDNFLFSLIWSNPIDVMSLATCKLESIRHKMVNFKLTTVAQQLGIEISEEKAHDGLYDIEITRDILYKLAEPIDNKKQDLVNNFLPGDKQIPIPKLNSNILTYNSIMPLGKYKGLDLDSIIDIDPQYIIWCSENVDRITIDSTLIEEVNQIIYSKKL